MNILLPYKNILIFNIFYTYDYLVGQKSLGAAGYRSPYLSHAKRALYHLSYCPPQGCVNNRSIAVFTSDRRPDFPLGHSIQICNVVLRLILGNINQRVPDPLFAVGNDPSRPTRQKISLFFSLFFFDAHRSVQSLLISTSVM